MFKNAFANLQKVGKSLMLPVSVLPIAGILLGVGSANFSWLPAVVSHVMAEAGGSVFANMPLIFAIGVALGFTNNDGVSALAAVVAYGIMVKTMAVVAPLVLHLPADEIAAKHLADTGVLGGIISGAIAAYMFNRFYRIKLPEYLGFFAGKRFVPIISGLAAIFTGVILSFIWPPIGSAKPRWLVLLAIATGGLFGNFILFSSSLQYLSPTASQVIGQLSPVGMMVASVVILKERMRGTQVVGALMLLCGLVMFFNTSLIEIFTRLTDYTWGVIFGVAAATVWVSYGVAQKVLLRRLASQQILFLLYTLCTIALLPLAEPGVISRLSSWQLACLIFCGLNTLVGYGALAEAMARWQAAQVSALITLTPLFTLLFSDLLSMAWPDVFARPMLNLIGYLGAFVVVAGAMYSAIGHRLWGRWRKREAVVPLPRSGE